MAGPESYRIDGRYDVLKTLGDGLSGEVMLVSENGTQMALKFLKKVQLNVSREDALNNFKHEFEILKELNHPNIARILDFGFDQRSQKYYFTSEFVAGATFDKACENQPVEVIERLLVQVLRALHYLHSRGTYHFDIKPQNVLVAMKDGVPDQAKIIDFGLAGYASPRKRVGTPAYMAPEVVMGGHLDGRTDLYSMGVLIYKVFTGVNPFATKSLKETLENQVHMSPRRPSEIRADLPEYWEHVILRLLEKNPASRYAQAALAIRDLNFLSQKNFEIETSDTKLSYLPEKGALIGREAEWQIFTEAFSGAFLSECASETRLIVVAGKKGTGKSRILSEIKYFSQLRNVPVRTLQQLKNGTSDLAQFLLIIEEGESDEAGVNDLLRELASQKCLVVWAVEDAPKGWENAAILELNNYAPEQLKQYVASVTGIAEIPETWTNEIFRRTHGNPLLVTEFIKALLNEDFLCNASGKWDASAFKDVKVDFDRLKLPESVDDYLLARFCDLPIFQKEILSWIAVHGEDLDVDALASLCGHGDAGKLSHHIVELVAGDFLRKTSREHTYFFSNPLYAKIIYRLLARRERQKRHERLARLFAEDVARRQSYLRHIGNSGEHEKAVEAFLELGESFRNEKKFAQAVEVLEKAREFLRPDDARRGEILFRLAESYSDQSQHALAVAILTELAASHQHQSPGDVNEAIVAVHKKLVYSYFVLNRIDDAERAILDAQKTIEGTGNPVWRMIFQNHCGNLKFRRGEVDEAEKIFLRTYADWSARLTDVQKKEVKNNRLIDVYLFKKKFQRAVEVSKQCIAVLEKSGNDMPRLAGLYYGLGDTYYRLTAEGENGVQQDLSEECLASFRKCEAIARVNDDKANLFKSFNGIGNMLFEKRDVEQAAQYYQRAFAIARDFHDQGIAAAIALNISHCHKDLGEWDDAYSFLVFAMNAFEGKGLKDTVTLKNFMMCCQTLAEVYLHRHQLDRAQATIDKIDALLGKHAFLSDYRFGRHFVGLKLYHELERDADFSAELALTRELATAANDREDLEAYLEKIGFESQPAVLTATPKPEVASRVEEPLPAVDGAVSISDNKSPKQERGAIKMLTDDKSTRHGGDDLQKIIEINSFINAERDFGQLLRMVLQYALQLSRAEFGFVILVDEGGALATAASLNATPADEERVSMSVVNKTLESGEIVASSDARSDERFDEAESVVLNELKSVLCLPIRSQNKAVGVFYLDNHFQTNVFENCNVSLLRAFCDQVGIALENARLFRKLSDAQFSLEDKLQKTEEELAEVKNLLIEESGVFKSKYSYNNIISKSKEMQTVFKLLDKVTETNLSVFLYGESGTGKELVAKALHYNNPTRGKKRFVAINCGAIPINLMESELFGHKLGSFTGAIRDKKGMFEEANGGTLFLDEIGELPHELQVKLLRVLQEGEVQRIGDNHVTKVDVRVVSASLKDIETMVKAGKFREDLYYRLCQMRINLPPLRTRKDDIPALAKHFVKQYCHQNKIETPIAIPPEFMKALLEYDWAGNIRELENLIAVACALQDRGELSIANLPDHYGIKKLAGRVARAGDGSGAALDGLGEARSLADATTASTMSSVKIDTLNHYDPAKTWRDYEAMILAKCYEYYGKKKKQVADALDLSHSTVYKKIDDMNLDDASHALYAEMFSYDGKSTMRDYVRLIFQAALDHHGGHPYAAIRQLAVSQGYFYKIIKLGRPGEMRAEEEVAV